MGTGLAGPNSRRSGPGLPCSWDDVDVSLLVLANESPVAIGRQSKWRQFMTKTFMKRSQLHVPRLFNEVFEPLAGSATSVRLRRSPVKTHIPKRWHRHTFGCGPRGCKPNLSQAFEPVGPSRLAPSLARTAARGDRLHVRMKPSTSLSAQARVFSMASPCMWRTIILVMTPCV
jgi:hypothetical protein